MGTYPRPWHDPEQNPEAEIFGYFNVKDFNPQTWVTEYPNSAFSEERYDDALWMARILAKFTREQLAAVIKTAKLHNEQAEAYLLDTLLGRRDKILKEYFTKYAPLSDFALVRETPGEPAQSLCFSDLAIGAGSVEAKKTLYKARLYTGRQLDQEIGWIQVQPDAENPNRTCIKRPFGDVRPSDFAPQGAPDDHALRYAVMKLWIHQKASLHPSSAINVYFYDLGPEKGYRMVGIEHPDKPVTPELY